MLLTVGQFCDRAQNDCDNLIVELKNLTGRFGEEEEKAWRVSLRKLSQALGAASFQSLHLFFGSRGNLALEYQLPASSAWADVVLLGKHQDISAAVILELKNWATASDRPGKAEGLIERTGRQELHPSDQVRGYAEYCRNFHSAVDAGTKVYGCVLFTHEPYKEAYTKIPNQHLTDTYPIFTLAPDDVQNRLPAFFSSRLTEPHESFATKFANGRYRQQRGFVAQIGAQILDPKSKRFELLDNQRRAFALCRAAIEESFFNNRSGAVPKRVVIVKGPPGSGKSAIAARLWASLVTDERLPEGDVVFTTTSQSQNSNWSYVFDQIADEGGHGLIRKATAFTPITTQQLGRLRAKHGKTFLEGAGRWRDHLQLVRDLGVSFTDGSRDNQNLITVVDEAHSLINPEHKAGRGQFGFVTSLGPQAFHIIRSSLLTIFLLDPQQGFRERENTTLDDIIKWSHELGAGEPEIVDLEGSQFRCAGSAEYVTWIESVLDGQPVAKNQVLASAWTRPQSEAPPENVIDFQGIVEQQNALIAAEQKIPYGTKPKPVVRPAGFDFRIFDNPEEMEAELRKRAAEGDSVRLLSTYSRPWKTADAAAPHKLPPELQDFFEPYEFQGKEKVWSRVWNFIPRNGSDYTAFIRGTPGSRISEDPLSEVGCPYAVRGFDYDYVGVVWLDDLLWRDGEWLVNADAVHETGISSLAIAARRQQKKQGGSIVSAELISRVTQAYRIVFTRALKGVYVWISDDQTRLYLSGSL